MKKLKTLFAVGLFVMGLGFTSCSSDDDYVPQNTDEVAQPIAPGAENPIAQPPTVAPA
ncbi:hypothetical protein [Carboxylicivirga sp. N1Y90]|uniref:hypothetical protein n=1 Tax=Carboxylicivirga fragile TaxID=3417571 RepID=UPI003D33B2C9|nr:hypothetical protein [Marinilabiliaceae bacterium N1Y90]